MLPQVITALFANNILFAICDIHQKKKKEALKLEIQSTILSFIFLCVCNNI